MLYFHKEPFVLIKISPRAEERSDRRLEWNGVLSVITSVAPFLLSHLSCLVSPPLLLIFLIFKLSESPGVADQKQAEVAFM